MGSPAKAQGQQPTLEELVGRIVGDYEEILDVSLSVKTALFLRKVRPEAEDQLVPILREAFVNVLQHAGSNKASLKVSQIGEQVALVVANTDATTTNLALATPTDVLARERGIGLESMQSRIQHLDGRFAFESKFGVFTIELQIPIEAVFETK
jgi:signal transduction histidine kinase